MSCCHWFGAKGPCTELIKVRWESSAIGPSFVNTSWIDLLNPKNIQTKELMAAFSVLAVPFSRPAAISAYSVSKRGATPATASRRLDSRPH